MATVGRMGYPQRKLNPDEVIALDLHPHWWYFAEPAFSLAGAAILGTLLAVNVDHDSTLYKVGGYGIVGVLIVCAIWLVGRYLKWVTTNFVITSQRLIFRQGVFAKSGIEIPLDRVNNVNFNQSIFERILGAGDLLIESGGKDGQQRFTDIKHPDRVQSLVHAEIERLGVRRAGGTVVDRRDDLDVAEQLERLEGMLERGTLTEEEFEGQKRRLLGLE